MRLRVHFGPRSVLVDTDDVDTIVHHAVGLARLVLPRGFCKFLLPRGSDIAPLGVACGSARCPAFARCVLENPPQGAGESKTTTTIMNGEEVRLNLMLEVQTRTHGPLLVINRRQWSWTRDVLKRELLQQSPSPSAATAVDTINNNDSGGGGGGETGGNSVETVLPLEVIFLYRGAESGVLRVCRYETFVDQPPPHDVHQAVEMVSVVDDCGNKMGELHFDCTRPPPLNRLKRSLQTLLSRSCSMNVSYRTGENTELISIQGDQEIINLVRSLQHFGTRNILLVVSLPSSASLPSVPARDGTPYMHRASPSHSPLPPSTSLTTRAPRPTPFASNDSTAVDSKREETRNMVGSYVQIMRGLRQGVADETDEKIHQAASPPSSEIPSPPVLNAVEEQEEEPNEKTPAPAAAEEEEAATTVVPSVTNHDDVSILANSMHAATDASGRKGNELLLVHYELNPVVVHITGRITEMELCSLADAIVAWYLQSKKMSENNNFDPGDAATEGKKFQRVSDSTYTLQLNECGVLDDAQVEKLKACLVDVVKGFGCRQLCETTKEGLVECLNRYSEQKNR